uniref:Tachylectin 2 domain-containing protein n=1 Tax=Leptobrachium leishanense TaxID=445787 RepID=A0A8C5Q125_9ANUR
MDSFAIMDTADTILFAVKDYNARAGLPPKNIEDNFNTCSIVGKLNNVSKIIFNPDGELFAVRDGELYRGSMPSNENLDWFSSAKRVGKADWDQFKFLLLDSQGVLYAATKNGELYKGPAPSNENVFWLHDEATMVGAGGWNDLDALFFDRQDILYAVVDNKLVWRSPPTKPDDNWLSTCTTIGNEGWSILTHFMAVSPDGDLWCVDSSNGHIYKGPIPADSSFNYMEKAEKLGVGYNVYPFMSFTIDKTIQRIVSCEFLPDLGKILNQTTEVLPTKTYNNMSNSPMRQTFSVSKTLTATRTFQQEGSFTVAVGADLTFKAGIPHITESEAKISVAADANHTWSYTKENAIQTTFSSIDIEVQSGHAIRLIASAAKVEMEVPYRMVIRTLFGYETTITGTWRGICYYNLMVTQEDCTP